MDEYEEYKRIYNPKKALDILLTVLFIVVIGVLYKDIVKNTAGESSVAGIVVAILSLLFIVLSVLDLLHKLKKY